MFWRGLLAPDKICPKALNRGYLISEAHLSTQSNETQTVTRFSQAHGLGGRQEGLKSQKASGSQATCSLDLPEVTTSFIQARGMNPMKDNPPPVRLRSPEAFERLFAHARRIRGEDLNVLFEARGDDQPSSWGIAVGKKGTTAVKRNQIKRVIRERIRHQHAKLPAGYDFIFEVLPRARTLGKAALTKKVDHLLNRLSKKFQVT